MPQNLGVYPSGAGLHISCQDVNFREIKDMKRRSKHFGGMSEFTSIADTLIFEFGEIATICGSRISSAEVWIKVCNSQSRGPARTSDHQDVNVPYNSKT
jgi:hypothetical protein